MTQAGQYTSMSKKNKRLVLAFFASFLLVAAIIAIAIGVNSHKNSTKNDAAHALLMASCNSTRYPDLCYSAATSFPDDSAKSGDPKAVILKNINATIDAINSKKIEANKILSTKNPTKKQKTALEDCTKNYDSSLADLDKVWGELNRNPNNKKLQQQSYADELTTKVSACKSNEDSCFDGFSHSTISRKLRDIFLGSSEDNAGKMCSNTLSLIKGLIEDAQAIANRLKTTSRKLKEEDDSDEGWPEWLSVTDRRLFQSSLLTPDVVVAADGSGKYRTVSAAVADAPKHSAKRYIIKIKAGVYRENVEVPSEKTNIMFLGDGRKKTIITSSRNVVDGGTTYHSATVAVVGKGFLARDITFQNTAGASKYQAVALRVESDFAAFYKCGMVAYQNTLHVHSNRQFFTNCYIAGTVDFIFGNSAAVFQDCDIRARRPNPGQTITITAQGRSDPNQNTGIVIQKSRIGATPDLQHARSNFSAYLGRPWKEYSRTVIMQSSISDVISPAGWREWKGRFALNTLHFAEYENSGAGAGTAGRVPWKGYKVITDATEAQAFTARNFITGSSWLKSTTFPFSLGL
ncbi:pectinesterase-like [Populus alba x Populus x berolinensis]|uniref:Pectinesterase n=1 Tax=Populus alba x Populus x berolinensis TaxID=444605 RepID=A0AAD6R5B0_9ROSI|nr:pectinesterase-like [Populus alba x Populus x berolinensis]